MSGFLEVIVYMQANKHYKLLAKQLNKQTLIIVPTLHQDIETNLLAHHYGESLVSIK